MITLVAWSDRAPSRNLSPGSGLKKAQMPQRKCVSHLQSACGRGRQSARGDSMGCECDLRDGSRRGHDPIVPARPSIRTSVSAHARSLAWTEMTDASQTPRSRSPPPVALLCRSPVASSVTRSDFGGTRLHTYRLAQALNIERCRPRLLLGRSAGRQPRLRGRAYVLSIFSNNCNYESTVQPSKEKLRLSPIP